MTNEELTARIQAGERDCLEELWQQVERFVAWRAGHYMNATGGRGGVEFDDLYNAGYLALVAAVDSYDPDGGCKFIGWLAFYLKKTFREATGLRTRRQMMDPLNQSASLDAPVGEDGDTPLGEFQADPGAAREMEGVVDRLYREQLGAALEEMLAALPGEQRDTLRRRYYRGWTLEQIATAQGVDVKTAQRRHKAGLRARRRDWHRLARFVEERTPYYQNYNAHTGERTAEMIAIQREGLAEKWSYQNLPGAGASPRG